MLANKWLPFAAAQMLLLVASLRQPVAAAASDDDEELRVDPLDLLRQQHSPAETGAALDPFAFTFEDYLREASKSASGGGGGGDTRQQVVPAARRQQLVDYVFPASNKDEQEQSAGGGAGEIKLLFGWRTLPTNKCSRKCGKGFRLVHSSCIDLKFDVRVEDELCAGIGRPPGESRDEPCNEFDCAPELSRAEFKQCNSSSLAQIGECEPSVRTQIECTQLNRHGQRVRLDESRCNGDDSGGGRAQSEPKSKEATNKIDNNNNIGISRQQAAEVRPDEDELVSLGDQLEPRNELVGGPTFFAAPSGGSGGHKFGSGHVAEPFYELGEWSECAHAHCGQLGKRSRNITCRLHLSRSGKLVELPLSSCQAIVAAQPDTEEPCYMDCAPLELNKDRSLYATETRRPDDQLGEDDESVFDVDTARFVWKHAGWTKCSADCLGGRSESIIECWDKIAELAVGVTLCDASLKPQPLVEVCNEIACPPEWRTEPFSNCSRACGSTGLRTRSVACVQQVPLETGHSSYMLVANELCLAQGSTSAASGGQQSAAPHQFEPCNRVDCAPEWSVGQWGECSASRCTGERGARNRTVVCVREFATAAAASNWTQPGAWQPGKATQVGPEACLAEYKSAPASSESCRGGSDRGGTECASVGATLDTATSYIDADPLQNFKIYNNPFDGTRQRKTVTLKVGGRAQIVEGKNLKIRCKIIGRQPNLVNIQSGKSATTATLHKRELEWLKDGVRIFAPNSTSAEMLLVEETDNSIIGPGNDLHGADLMAADEPEARRAQRLATATHRRSFGRSLQVRSSLGLQEADAAAQHQSFNFVAVRGGRFSLVRENTLRIKRLRPEDSGRYSCSSGLLSESLDLQVVGRRQHLLQQSNERLAANSY